MSCEKTPDSSERVIKTFLRNSTFAGTARNKLFRLILPTIVVWSQVHTKDTSTAGLSMLKVSVIKNENSSTNMEVSLIWLKRNLFQDLSCYHFWSNLNSETMVNYLLELTTRENISDLYNHREIFELDQKW